MDMIKNWLDEYQGLVIDAIADGYDGTVHAPEEEQYSWSYASAFLFTASILTTIGQSMSLFFCCWMTNCGMERRSSGSGLPVMHLPLFSASQCMPDVIHV